MSFDPYLEWLGIAEGRRPPTHYELLGLKPFESQLPAIDDAILARAALVRKYQVGRREEEAQRLLEELQQAYGCLSDPARKAAYDSSLRGATTLADDPTNETHDDDDGAVVPLRPLRDDSDFQLDPMPPVLPQPAMQPVVAPVPVARPNPVSGSAPTPVAPRPIALPVKASGQQSTVVAASGIGLPRAMQAALAVAAAVVVLFVIGQMFSSTDTSTSAPAEGDVASVEVVPATVTPPEVEANPAAMPQPTSSAPVVPNLSPIAPQQINEGRELMLKATTTNAPPTGKSWAFRLEPGAPAGAKIDPATGILTWTPTEEQGPNEHTFSIVAFDPTAPELRSTTSFTVDVKEVNRAPVLEPISDQVAEVGKLLCVDLVAKDADVPAQWLYFKLEPGAPQSAEVNSVARVFTWTPQAIDAGKSHRIAVTAFESNANGLSDTKTFRVNVKPPSAPEAAPPLVAAATPGVDLSTVAPLFFADFTKEDNGFRTNATSTGSRAVHANGVYQFSIAPTFTGRLSTGRSSPQCPSVEDFTCELTARVATRVANPAWGLSIFCRNKSGGRPQLRVMLDSQSTLAVGNQTVPCDNVRPGSAFNTMLVMVRGRNVDVSINGRAAITAFNSPEELLPARFDLTFDGNSGDIVEYQQMKLWAGRVLPETGQPAIERKTISNSIGMQFVEIPAGSFKMGSPLGETGRSVDEGPLRDVRITKPFYLGTYEVTQQEFETVTTTNPSWSTNMQGPVDSITPVHVANFIKRLGALPAEKKAGRTYRLPTEAEWEFACRAGSSSPYTVGATLDPRFANVPNDPNLPRLSSTRIAPRRPVNVGSYAPNAFGLFDMHGNVAELCQDRYDAKAYANSVSDDPIVKSGKGNVVRGGSWNMTADRCRSAARAAYTPDRSREVGFRVVCEVP